jgi:hypothetical protein
MTLAFPRGKRREELRRDPVPISSPCPVRSEGLGPAFGSGFSTLTLGGVAKTKYIPRVMRVP